MITNFQIVSAATVPQDYMWDKGTPFSSLETTSPAYATSTYISGYAPGLKIKLINTSVPNPEYFNTSYEWSFGDFYNDVGTYTLSCLSEIEHIYLLPGKYTVTLKQKQIKVNSDIILEDSTCLGLYGIRWFWDDLQSDKKNNLTWNQLTCTVPAPASFKLKKQWVNETDCLQKFCRFWSWQQLACNNSLNPVTWSQAQTNGSLPKKWEFENNDTECIIPNATFLNSEQLIEKDYIIQNFIEVKELLPVAGLYSVTQPTTGIFPFTVQLTPRTTKTGSFPIDRIDWDFGNNTPITTITRQGIQLGIIPLNTIFTNIFSADPFDVRNYDIIHTYINDKNTYPVFYPSLTCYSANTNSSDSCCITIGPLQTTPFLSASINLIKTKKTIDGNLYVFDIEDNLVFCTTNTSTSSVKDINIPKAKIRNTLNQPVMYLGNPGTGYPPPYTPTCL